jgi:hypothetical protein
VREGQGPGFMACMAAAVWAERVCKMCVGSSWGEAELIVQARPWLCAVLCCAVLWEVCWGKLLMHQFWLLSGCRCRVIRWCALARVSVGPLWGCRSFWGKGVQESRVASAVKQLQRQVSRLVCAACLVLNEPAVPPAVWFA